MDFDLTPYFEKYEKLSQLTDQVFEQVKTKYPECVTCKTECADCCHAMFDLSLIEALYINHHSKERFSDEEQAALLERANRADRQAYKIKRNAAKAVQGGTPETEVLESLAAERVRCPLLNDKDLCELYEHRPITCRLYGIPTAIGGKGRTCQLSGFKAGEPYPTVNIEEIQNQLYALSAELIQDMKSKNFKMADILMPLSMALLTVFDEECLGMLTDHEKQTGGDNG